MKEDGVMIGESGFNGGEMGLLMIGELLTLFELLLI